MDMHQGKNKHNACIHECAANLPTAQKAVMNALFKTNLSAPHPSGCQHLAMDNSGNKMVCPVPKKTRQCKNNFSGPLQNFLSAPARNLVVPSGAILDSTVWACCRVFRWTNSKKNTKHLSMGVGRSGLQTAGFAVCSLRAPTPVVLSYSEFSNIFKANLL